MIDLGLFSSIHHIGFTNISFVSDAVGPENLNYVADALQKEKNAPLSEFEISHDDTSSTWYVEGSGLHRFIQMTNWR